MNIKITTSNTPTPEHDPQKKCQGAQNGAQDSTPFSKESYEKALSYSKERIAVLEAENAKLTAALSSYQSFIEQHPSISLSLSKDDELRCKEEPDSSADMEEDEFEEEEQLALDELPEMSIAELSGEIDAYKYCIHAILSWVFDNPMNNSKN